MMPSAMTLTPLTLAVRATRTLAVASLLALIALCLAWELWLAPLRPGGSWLALKALPLCLPLAGLLKNRMYTYRWLSLVVWLYFIEGVVRAWSDPPPGNWLAMLEIALCLAIFAACAPMHVRLRFRNAKALAAAAAAHRRTAMNALLDELRHITGAAHVFTDGDLSAFTQDWRRRAHGKALAVVRPGSTEEVAAIVKACAATRRHRREPGAAGRQHRAGVGSVPDTTGRRWC
jgi:uncharacterized membrane protein